MRAAQVVALDISLATDVRGSVQPDSATVRKLAPKVTALVLQKASLVKESKPAFAVWHALAVPADAQNAELTVGFGGTTVGLLTVGVGDGEGGLGLAVDTTVTQVTCSRKSKGTILDKVVPMWPFI